MDEVAVLTQALSSALCTHAEMLVQKAVAERDAAMVGVGACTFGGVWMRRACVGGRLSV